MTDVFFLRNKHFICIDTITFSFVSLSLHAESGGAGGSSAEVHPGQEGDHGAEASRAVPGHPAPGAGQRVQRPRPAAPGESHPAGAGAGQHPEVRGHARQAAQLPRQRTPQWKPLTARALEAASGNYY